MSRSSRASTEDEGSHGHLQTTPSVPAHRAVHRSTSRLIPVPADFGKSTVPLVDPTPMPNDVPKVSELGVTSAPLKSASFFLGTFCKDYSGPSPLVVPARA